MTEAKIEDMLSEAYARRDDCPPPESFLRAEWDDLGAAVREEVLRHVASCPACAAERDLAMAFDAPPAAGRQPAAELDGVLERIAAESPVEHHRAGSVLRFPALARVVPRRALGLAAAALLVVAAGAVLRNRSAAPGLPAAPTHDVVRGGRITLLSPVGPLDAQPAAFEWREAEAAREVVSYRVTLSAVDETVLWTATARTTSLDLPEGVRRSLDARVVYSWRVEAFDNRGARVAWSEAANFSTIPGPTEEPTHEVQP